MIALQPIIQDPDVLPEVRDLFSEYPELLGRTPALVRRVLRALRGVESDVFAVEGAMEALRVEGEVLA
jgi:hypothetical protein